MLKISQTEALLTPSWAMTDFFKSFGGLKKAKAEGLFKYTKDLMVKKLGKSNIPLELRKNKNFDIAFKKHMNETFNKSKKIILDLVSKDASLRTAKLKIVEFLNSFFLTSTVLDDFKNLDKDLADDKYSIDDLLESIGLVSGTDVYQRAEGLLAPLADSNGKITNEDWKKIRLKVQNIVSYTPNIRDPKDEDESQKLSEEGKRTDMGMWLNTLAGNILGSINKTLDMKSDKFSLDQTSKGSINNPLKIENILSNVRLDNSSTKVASVFRIRITARRRKGNRGKSNQTTQPNQATPSLPPTAGTQEDKVQSISGVLSFSIVQKKFLRAGKEIPLSVKIDLSYDGNEFSAKLTLVSKSQMLDTVPSIEVKSRTVLDIARQFANQVFSPALASIESP